jgi:hypothetical protein
MKEGRALVALAQELFHARIDVCDCGSRQAGAPLYEQP